MKRPAQPTLSDAGEAALAPYVRHLYAEQDLSAATRRNYLSDLRQFAAWCELSWAEGQDELRSFAPTAVSTPTITTYRSYLQTVVGLRPSSINRHLVSIKRYLAWAVDTGLVARDPSRVVKLIPRTAQPPRHLTDREEQALVAAVSQHGSLRDRTLLILALHTGLRAEELCRLKREHVHLGRRSGYVAVYGKRNKYREVPLNSTARDALSSYLQTLPHESAYLFPSRKRGESGGDVGPVGERALVYIVSKYAEHAHVRDLSPHDLRHRFGYRMAQTVPLHRLAQLMGHDSLDTTLRYVRGTQQDLQQAVETIAWA
ncbi:MAG TPA: tyrosine-type recombinase/integrase [Ktedonobacterales bacterium]|nr:tyrosine-type recombinase/integrase [Ktedonobacterales bacterium]